MLNKTQSLNVSPANSKKSFEPQYGLQLNFF